VQLHGRARRTTVVRRLSAAASRTTAISEVPSTAECKVKYEWICMKHHRHRQRESPTKKTATGSHGVIAHWPSSFSLIP